MAELESGTFEETWASPARGIYMGVGARVKEGSCPFMEFMAIEPNEDHSATLWMVLGKPANGGLRVEPFLISGAEDHRMIACRGGDATPASIVYERTETGMRCILLDPAGDPIQIFAFKRVD